MSAFSQIVLMSRGIPWEVLKDAGDGVFGKQKRAARIGACYLQPLFDVPSGFARIQRRNRARWGDSLLQLSELGRVQLVVELGLADE